MASSPLYDDPFASAAAWLCPPSAAPDGECLATASLAAPSAVFLLVLPFAVGAAVTGKRSAAHRAFARYGVGRWPWRLVIGATLGLSALHIAGVALALESGAPGAITAARGVVAGHASAAGAWLLDAAALAVCYRAGQPLGDFHLAWHAAFAAMHGVPAGFAAARQAGAIRSGGSTAAAALADAGA